MARGRQNPKTAEMNAGERRAFYIGVYNKHVRLAKEGGENNWESAAKECGLTTDSLRQNISAFRTLVKKELMKSGIPENLAKAKVNEVIPKFPGSERSKQDVGADLVSQLFPEGSLADLRAEADNLMGVGKES